VNIQELARLDLNLLVALEALLEEGSVSRAAERLHVTQSAMSKTLGRLRELFDDPLFVRRGGAMVPTPRAEQLGRQLPALLQAVHDFVQPEKFDPLAFEGEFHLLVQGHMGVWFLPELVKRLQLTAPGIRLQCLSRADDANQRLADGALDLILHTERRTYPQDVQLTTLGFAQPTLLARKGHPLEGGELDWEQIRAYPQVMLLLRDLAEIQFVAGEDSPFLQFESTIEPQFETDDLQTALQVVRQTDCLFPAPPMFSAQFDTARSLVPLTLPGSEEVSVKYVAVRHERTLNSAPHNFLFAEVLAVTEAFRAQFELPSLAAMRRLRGLAY
jgi:DNA-binding transcriptional LysR family regulator